MSARTMGERRLLPLVLLAALLGTIAFAPSAKAQIAMDIVDGFNGPALGSIVFPTTSGSSPAGVELTWRASPKRTSSASRGTSSRCCP